MRGIAVAVAILTGCSTPPATFQTQASPVVQTTNIELPDARFTWENCDALHRTGALPTVNAPFDTQLAALSAQRRVEYEASEITRRCRDEIGGWNFHRTTDRMTDRTYCFARYTLRASYPGLRLLADRLTIAPPDSVLRGYRLRFDDQAAGAWRMASSSQILNGAMHIRGADFARISQSRRLRVETSEVGGGGVYDLDLTDITAVMSVLRSPMCASEAVPLDVTPFRLRSQASEPH